MDYGQPVNTPNQEPFFTAGAGNAPETVNTDKSNSLTSEAYIAERDPKNLGNVAIASSSEQAPTTTELPPENQSPNEMPNKQGLGQIINLEMPPGSEQTPEDNTEKAPTFDRASISTSKKLSRAGLRAIDSVTSKLSKDGDVYDFYEEIRGENGLVEANLENSYNRKLAAWVILSVLLFFTTINY